MVDPVGDVGGGRAPRAARGRHTAAGAPVALVRDADLGSARRTARGGRHAAAGIPVPLAGEGRARTRTGDGGGGGGGGEKPPRVPRDAQLPRASARQTAILSSAESYNAAISGLSDDKAIAHEMAGGEEAVDMADEAMRRKKRLEGLTARQDPRVRRGGTEGKTVRQRALSQRYHQKINSIPETEGYVAAVDAAAPFEAKLVTSRTGSVHMRSSEAVYVEGGLEGDMDRVTQSRRRIQNRRQPTMVLPDAEEVYHEEMKRAAGEMRDAMNKAHTSSRWSDR